MKTPPPFRARTLLAEKRAHGAPLCQAPCANSIMLDGMSDQDSLAIRTAARDRAHHLIVEHSVKVVRVARHLIENKRISGAEFDALMIM